jgi:hypothetical protein
MDVCGLADVEVALKTHEILLKTYKRSQLERPRERAEHLTDRNDLGVLPMTIPAWQVISWSPVVTTVPAFEREIAKLRHLGTSVHTEELENGLRQGQVLWGVDEPSYAIGIAWDWAEVREDVVAVVDPMKVLSNVTLVDENGVCLNESSRIVYLNSAIHELRWQEGICGPRALFDEHRRAA